MLSVNIEISLGHVRLEFSEIIYFGMVKMFINSHPRTFDEIFQQLLFQTHTKKTTNFILMRQTKMLIILIKVQI